MSESSLQRVVLMRQITNGRLLTFRAIAKCSIKQMLKKKMTERQLELRARPKGKVR